MNDYKNMNLVICVAQLDIDNWGMLEKRINSKPVSQNFVVWFMNRYPEKPLYAYFIGNVGTKFFDDKILSKAFQLEEKKLQTYVKKHKLL